MHFKDVKTGWFKCDLFKKETQIMGNDNQRESFILPQKAVE